MKKKKNEERMSDKSDIQIRRLCELTANESYLNAKTVFVLGPFEHSLGASLPDALLDDDSGSPSLSSALIMEGKYVE